VSAANRIDHEPAYPVDTANLERSRKLPPPRHRQIPASKPEWRPDCLFAFNATLAESLVVGHVSVQYA